MRLLQGNRLLDELGSARQLDDHNLIEHEAPGKAHSAFPARARAADPLRYDGGDGSAARATTTRARGLVDATTDEAGAVWALWRRNGGGGGTAAPARRETMPRTRCTASPPP